MANLPVGTPTNSKMKDPVFKKDKIEHLFELEHQYALIINDYAHKADLNLNLWAPYYAEAIKPWVAKRDAVMREIISILGPEYEPKKSKDASVPAK